MKLKVDYKSRNGKRTSETVEFTSEQVADAVLRGNIISRIQANCPHDKKVVNWTWIH